MKLVEVAGLTAAAALLVSSGSSSAESRKSTEVRHMQSAKVGHVTLPQCTYSKPNHVREFSDASDSPPTNSNYCLVSAEPMGMTDIIKGGDDGELGLIHLKLYFMGKPLDCVVPTTQTNGATSHMVIRGEAFSLNSSCRP